MKSYFEEHGGTYTQIGEYLLPNLVMDPQPEGEIGIWGWRRKRYLKEHRKGTYNAMLRQMTTAEGVTEELKRRNQLGWVRRMNNIRNRAEEIVRNELIYS